MIESNTERLKKPALSQKTYALCLQPFRKSRVRSERYRRSTRNRYADLNILIIRNVSCVADSTGHVVFHCRRIKTQLQRIGKWKNALVGTRIRPHETGHVLAGGWRNDLGHQDGSISRLAVRERIGGRNWEGCVGKRESRHPFRA